MARQRLEVADVVRTHLDAFVASRGGKVSAAERRVLDDIAACRTAARGGHVQQCEDCGHQRIAYNSCRDRHCPKCQEATRAAWLHQREQEVLPVEYFHVVFTVPQEIAAIALQNKRELYRILFSASADTLRQIAADPAHLGAEIGVLAVLHTWGQTLQYHPHVHCLVPGGGIAPDGSRWLGCKPGFFLPVRVLARMFRGKLLQRVRDAYDRGRLGFHGEMAHLQNPVAFRSYLAPLFEKDWVVYAKPPFAGPAVVLRYLARYATRVAISNSRLVEMTDDQVTFTWKDYRRGGKARTMTLGAVPFLRRFLLHILPKGFQRIRHYGFLANRCREAKLEQCRSLVAEDVAQGDGPAKPTPCNPSRCPKCETGTMVCILVISSGTLATLAALRAPPVAS